MGVEIVAFACVEPDIEAAHRGGLGNVRRTSDPPEGPHSKSVHSTWIAGMNLISLPL